MGVIAGHCAPRVIRLPLGIRKTARCRARHCARVAARAARINARRALRVVTARGSRRTAYGGARRDARGTATRCTTHGNGGVHTVDRRTRKRHHSLHDRVLGRNNWSPRRIPRRRVYVEQVFLDVVHHGVTALLKKRHDELPCGLAMLLCGLVLRLLHLLQYIKVAFQSCMLLVSVLFDRVYSAKTRRNHDTLHNRADCPALHRARPSNSQQAHDSAHRLTLKSPHDRLVCRKSCHQRIGTAAIGSIIKLNLCTDRTSRKWQPLK